MCQKSFLIYTYINIFLISFGTATERYSSQNHLTYMRELIEEGVLDKGGQHSNFLQDIDPTRVRRTRATNFSSEIESSINREQIGEKDVNSWSNINTQVDTVIPMILTHLTKMEIEHLNLPDIRETISLTPFLVTYDAHLILSNGIVYNVEGIERYGDAFMTYQEKAFLIRFNITLSYLQFEYNFLLQMMSIEGYGKVIGALDDTIVHAEMAVDVTNINLKLKNFRILKFRKIHVQLDQIQIIRQLTGLILTPITNLFKYRITTSISDGLEKQMEMIIDDFNNDDPLQLRTFAKQLLAGLTG